MRRKIDHNFFQSRFHFFRLHSHQEVPDLSLLSATLPTMELRSGKCMRTATIVVEGENLLISWAMLHLFIREDAGFSPVLVIIC